MKKMFLAAVAVIAAMSMGLNANAQVRLGILGGITSSDANVDVKNFDTQNVDLYHAGIAIKASLPFGFAIQPQVMYQVKGASLNEVIGSDNVTSGATDLANSFETKVGYIEVPVQIQWGPDLMICRPYVFAEPFVGYALNLKVNDANDVINDFKELNMNRFEYGAGLGVGLEIWKFQLSAKYFWNFGEITGEAKDLGNTFVDSVKDAFSNKSSFSGVSATLVLFF